MMAPCFSREAIKKVLYTFNANDSGWGIEWHWPIIIDSNHKDMAVIDDLIAIHTLPVKKEEKNIEECNLYIQKNHLDTTIYIYDRIFYGTSDLKRRGFKITKYQLYQYYKDWLDQTANHLILALKRKTSLPLELKDKKVSSFSTTLCPHFRKKRISRYCQFYL